MWCNPSDTLLDDSFFNYYYWKMSVNKSYSVFKKELNMLFTFVSSKISSIVQNLDYI